MDRLKIGYLDRNLNTSHPSKFLEILRGEVGQGEVEVVGAWESEPEGDWCSKHGVKRMATAEEVVEASDAIIVLAPNNPECHLKLARPALEAGRPVFIDKVLADGVSSAQEIVRLAQKYNSPLMAASALRFAPELDKLEDEAVGAWENIYLRGMGQWNGYGVHTITMAMRLFGPRVKRIIDTGSDGARFITLDDGFKRATIDVRMSKNQYELHPWEAGILSEGNYHKAVVSDFDGFYMALMREVVDFFRTGISSVSIEEMLMTIAIENAADLSLAEGGVWVEMDA